MHYAINDGYAVDRNDKAKTANSTMGFELTLAKAWEELSDEDQRAWNRIVADAGQLLNRHGLGAPIPQWPMSLPQDA